MYGWGYTSPQKVVVFTGHQCKLAQFSGTLELGCGIYIYIYIVKQRMEKTSDAYHPWVGEADVRMEEKTWSHSRTLVP